MGQYQILKVSKSVSKRILCHRLLGESITGDADSSLMTGITALYLYISFLIILKKLMVSKNKKGPKTMGIKIKAKFYANMRELLGKKELEIILGGSGVQTIRDVIDKIDELEGKDFKEKIIGTKDRPRRSIRIVLNGKQIDFLERFDTVVNDGDNVSFFPLIAAG